MTDLFILIVYFLPVFAVVLVMTVLADICERFWP